jgi:flagellar basal body rod protein FlgG
MFLNPALSAALDKISERAADVRRAFTPGALPHDDDVATAGAISDFTLDPLSVSAADGFYFITRDARGDIGYTRDGGFALRGGQLVDEAGNAVARQLPDGRLSGLEIDAVDAALGRVRDPRIEPDGTLTYARSIVDPRSGRRELQHVTAGRIALARFPAGTRLESADGRRCTPPPGVVAEIGTAATGNVPALVPLHRDRSRIDVDQSLIRLREAYIAFDALQAAEATKAHLGKTVMDLVK